MGADCLCAPAPQKKVITMQQIVRKTSQQSVSRDKTSVKYSYTSSALSTRKLQSLRGESPPCLWLTSPEIFKRVRTKQTQWRVHPYFQFEARLLPDASASEHPVFLLKEPRYSGKIHAKKTILIPMYHLCIHMKTQAHQAVLPFTCGRRAGAKKWMQHNRDHHNKHYRPTLTLVTC